MPVFNSSKGPRQIFGEYIFIRLFPYLPVSHKKVLRHAFSDFITKYHRQLPELKRKQLVSSWEVHVFLVRHGEGHTPLIIYVYHTKDGPVFLAHTIPENLEDIRERLERAEEMLGVHVYPKFGTETGHAPDIPWGKEAATEALRLLLAAAVGKYGIDLKNVDKETYAALRHFVSRETIREPFGRQEWITGPLRIQGKHADVVFSHVHLYDAGEFRQPTSEEIRIVHPEEPIVLIWAPHLQDWSPEGLERYMGKVEKRVRPLGPVPSRCVRCLS